MKGLQNKDQLQNNSCSMLKKQKQTHNAFAFDIVLTLSSKCTKMINLHFSHHP